MTRAPLLQSVGQAPLKKKRFAAALALTVLVTACPPPAPEPVPPVDAPPTCDAGDEAFVREATLAILGRRPFSEAEVRAGAALIAQVDAQTNAQDDARTSAHEGRRVFARSLMRDSAYVDRWSAHLMDALYVPRTGGQALAECYGTRLRTRNEPGLAQYVRDAASDDGPEGDDGFTYLDLMRSSLLLDDVSPVYRAHMFAMLTRPNPCGNVDPIEQELAFRDEIGGTFDAAFLNRDPVCLACHNSESAVTDRDDPREDRHWPAFGKLEEAVFGSSFAVDPVVAHGPLRITGFLGEGGGGGGEFPIYDANIGYCFDEVVMDYVPAPLCEDGVPPACPGNDFGTFCLGFIDVPTCDADGNLTCANAPFCTDFENFAEAPVCSGGVMSCENPAADIPYCGDFNSQPFCDDVGVPSCPDEPPAMGEEGEGEEGEGEGEGIDPGAGGLLPWGADVVCGSFNPAPEDDIADVDAHLASSRGKRATVIDLEKALRRGADALAKRGVAVDASGALDGPDEAFATLIAMNVVDGVWREVVGSPLTIATKFPRNEAQKRALEDLTRHFVEQHWSLETLLVDVVTHPLFNMPAPDDASCANNAYDAAAVFDPWVLAEPDADMRNNSAADGVHALSSRTMLSAAYAALDWPTPDDAVFPFDDGSGAFGADGALNEAQFQRGVGVFHGISEKGFRGLDFQARLTWESRFGSCTPPPQLVENGTLDAVATIAARAVERDATVADAVSALKERLVNEPTFVGNEADALVGLVGSLGRSARAVDDLEARLRSVCGALLSSPQFQLAGIANEGGRSSSLSETDAQACTSLAARGADATTITCDAAGLHATR